LRRSADQIGGLQMTAREALADIPSPGFDGGLGHLRALATVGFMASR